MQKEVQILRQVIILMPKDIIMLQVVTLHTQRDCILNQKCLRSFRGVFYNSKRKFSLATQRVVYTTASGSGSHAEGIIQQQAESGSHAEGVSYNCKWFSYKNNGTNSHTEGWIGFSQQQAKNGSHAEGFNTVATEQYQHVEGLYNIVDTSGKLIHIIGNGSPGSRSNAFTVDVNGKIALFNFKCFGLNTAPSKVQQIQERWEK